MPTTRGAAAPNVSSLQAGTVPLRAKAAPSDAPNRPFGGLLSAEEFAAELGVSRRTVHRYVADGILPKPRKLGPRLSRWTREEVEAAKAKLAAAEAN